MGIDPKDRVGTVIGGRYRIDGVLGKGGMGVVLSGTHELTDRRVAIKLLHPEFAGDSDILARFFQEARSAAKLDHPNVVDTLDMGVEEGTEQPYLVLEMLDGEDLAHRILRKGPMSEANLLPLLLPVIDALAAAHEHSIVHRDLKPENIFIALDARGRPVPKVLDFGIAKLIAGESAVQTRAGGILGTPTYMSPEQIMGGGGIGPPSDVWSMGVVLYECLGGRVPFEADTLTGVLMQICSIDPPPLLEVAPFVQPGIAAVINHAMQRKVEDRIQTMVELGEALTFAAEEAGIELPLAVAGLFHESLLPPPHYEDIPPPLAAIPLTTQRLRVDLPPHEPDAFAQTRLPAEADSLSETNPLAQDAGLSNHSPLAPPTAPSPRTALSRTSPLAEIPPRRGRRGLWIGALAMFALVGASLFWFMGPAMMPSPPTLAEQSAETVALIPEPIAVPPSPATPAAILPPSAEVEVEVENPPEEAVDPSEDGLAVAEGSEADESGAQEVAEERVIPEEVSAVAITAAVASRTMRRPSTREPRVARQAPTRRPSQATTTRAREPAQTPALPAPPSRATEATPARPGRLSLDTSRGQVIVIADGGWAEVFHNGRSLGRTPLRTTLPVGDQRLRLVPFGDGTPRRVNVAVEWGAVADIRIHVAPQLPVAPIPAAPTPEARAPESPAESESSSARPHSSSELHPMPDSHPIGAEQPQAPAPDA